MLMHFVALKLCVIKIPVVVFLICVNWPVVFPPPPGGQEVCRALFTIIVQIAMTNIPKWYTALTCVVCAGLMVYMFAWRPVIILSLWRMSFTLFKVLYSEISLPLMKFYLFRLIEFRLLTSYLPDVENVNKTWVYFCMSYANPSKYRYLILHTKVKTSQWSTAQWSMPCLKGIPSGLTSSKIN